MQHGGATHNNIPRLLALLCLAAPPAHDAPAAFYRNLGALALIELAAALPEPWLLPAVPVCGYFFAWVGHFLVEKNRPATFTYPLFSLIGDFHMYALMWQARMDSEVTCRQPAPSDESGQIPQ